MQVLQTMQTLCRTFRRPAVSTSLLLLALLCTSAACAQQASPSIAANLEQSANGLVRGISTPSGRELPTLLPEDFDKVPITPGTLLEVRVYRVPELSGTYRVDERGKIVLPMLGAVRAVGKTPSQLQAELGASLASEGWLVAPQVNVDVLQFALQSTTVLGEVQMPGRISLSAPKPLPAVLAMAGGETTAAGSEIEIEHVAGAGIEARAERVEYPRDSGPASIAKVIVQPGDTVFVHRAGIVYVLGAVTRPGGYLMVDRGSLDLTQAIALAQGTTLIASTGKVWIVRRQGGAVVEIPVEYTKVLKGREPSPGLQPEDVVYVAVSKLKAAAVNGSAVLSAATSAAIYTGTGH